MMLVRSLVLWSTTLVLLLGCETKHYEIEMESRGPEVQRTITVWQVEDDVVHQLPPDELERIAKLYPRRLTDPDDVVQAFSGKFREELPNDVGGAGSYIYLKSEMGEAWAYVERFQGDDAPAKKIEEELGKANRMADQLLGWLTEEMGTEPGFDKLREFLDGPMRDDLKNLATYAWMGRSLDKNADMAVRSLQYLVERGYLLPKELPRYTRMMVEVRSQDRPQALLAFLQRQVATRMGVAPNEPIPASLDFMGELQTAEASLATYLKTTPEYSQMIAEWKKRPKPVDSLDEPPGPCHAFVTPEFSRALFMFMVGSDRLESSLAITSTPWLTNGTWDAADGRVRWTAGLNGEIVLPSLCYAMWASPDKAYQEAHFGQVVFEDARLLAYGLWRDSLSEQQADEWNRLVNSLRPGPGLLKQLETFRFSDDPPPVLVDDYEISRCYASWPIGMICETLENKGRSRASRARDSAAK